MIKSAWVCVIIFKDLEEMVVKSLDDDDSSDEKLNGIQKVSYLHGEKCFAIGVLWSPESKTRISLSERL